MQDYGTRWLTEAQQDLAARTSHSYKQLFTSHCPYHWTAQSAGTATA